MDNITIIEYYVSDDTFVIYYRRNSSVLCTYVDLSARYDVLSREPSFIKRLIKYYLSSSTSQVLKEEFYFFLKRLIMTPEELDRELYTNHKVNLVNKDVYIYSINRDFAYMFQDKFKVFSQARVNISDTIHSIKNAVFEVEQGLYGLDINDFLQSLSVNVLRKGLVNKILDKIPLEHKRCIRPEYIEKSLPYLYDEMLFSESVAELYLFDDFQNVKAIFGA